MKPRKKRNEIVFTSDNVNSKSGTSANFKNFEKAYQRLKKKIREL